MDKRKKLGRIFSPYKMTLKKKREKQKTLALSSSLGSFDEGGLPAGRLTYETQACTLNMPSGDDRLQNAVFISAQASEGLITVLHQKIKPSLSF